MTQRRNDSLELLARLTARVKQLDASLAIAAEADPNARRLMTP